MRPLGKAVDGRAWPGVARVGLTLARVGLHLSLERVEWLGGERRDQSERHAADRAVNELESGRSLAHGAARCGRHRCTGRADIAAANTARELPASRKCNSSRIREGKFMRVSLSLIPDESYIRYLVYQVSGIWYVSGIRYQVSGIRYQVSGIRGNPAEPGHRQSADDLVARLSARRSTAVVLRGRCS